MASVKVNTSGESATSGNFENGRLTLLNIPMKVIVARAYQVTNDRIAGPDWLDFDRFDIIAKSAPDMTGDAMWLMLRSLLADRFHLTIHREQPAVPVYALVAGKTGPKFKEASADSPEKVTCSRPDSQVTCRNQKTTMAQLAQNLPRWVSRNFFDLPVLDRTELHGVYDFSLTWTFPALTVTRSGIVLRRVAALAQQPDCVVSRSGNGIRSEQNGGFLLGEGFPGWRRRC